GMGSMCDCTYEFQFWVGMHQGDDAASHFPCCTRDYNSYQCPSSSRSVNSCASPSAQGVRSLGACWYSGLGGPFRPQPLTPLCNRSPSNTMLHTHTPHLRHGLAVCRCDPDFWYVSHLIQGIPSEYCAWLNPILRSHNALFFHHFDHPCGAIVADPQAALQHRDRRLPRLRDEGNGVIVSLVILVFFTVRTILHRRQKTIIITGLLPRFPILYQAVDLFFRHICSMHALRFRCTGRQKEHIASPKQRLCAIRIENRARVDFRGDLKRQPRWEIGLDDPCQHVYRWSLSRDN